MVPASNGGRQIEIHQMVGFNMSYTVLIVCGSALCPEKMSLLA